MDSTKFVNAAQGNPWMALAAACIAHATDDCRTGFDPEACAWLRRTGRSWLSIISPPEADIDALHRRLMDQAGYRAKVQMTIFDMAETR